MYIQLRKSGLRLEDVQKDHTDIQDYAPHERTVIEYTKDWMAGKTWFSFDTSGSTGKPKRISIPRKKIEYSCKVTMSKLDPDGKFKSTLLCLNPEMIGGAMVVFRALIHNMNLRVVPPESNPLHHLDPKEYYDLVSLVPLQAESATTMQLNRFNTILIGGADYTGTRPNVSARLYTSFGMTETVSHFALKRLGEDYYECIGDAQLVTGNDQCLRLKGTITDHQVLQTNDLVEVVSETRFKWLGRSDFVINSGGVKFHPERIEPKLKEHISDKFIVSSLPDQKLGNRLILIIEGNTDSPIPDLSHLSGYEKPKEVYFLSAFEMASSGKINRKQTQEKLLALMTQPHMNSK